MRALLVRLALVSISTLFALGSAEILLRYTAHRLVREGEWLEVGSVFLHDDPPVGFSLRPGSTRLSVKGGAYVIRDRINAQGMRDLDHPVLKPPGSRRLLVLGDSFMYGDGVEQEESMPRLLAASMPGVDVINAGVRAWNLDQEYLYYVSRGRRYGADAVLLAFFVNDLIHDPAYEVRDGADGLPVAYERTAESVERQQREAPRGWRGSAGAWLRSHSLLYTLVRSRLRGPGAAGAAASGRGAQARRRPSVPYLPIFEKGREGEVPPRWERAWRIMGALNDAVAADGARLVIVIVPAPWQIRESDWDAWVAWVQVDPGSLSRTRPQEMVAAWCRRSGVPCLDLAPRLGLGGDRRLYFEHDFHWTAEGHRAAAEATRALLAAEGLP